MGPLEKVPMFGVPHMDKFVHAFLFGMLVFFWWRYLVGRKDLSPAMKNLLIIFISASAFGIGMEFTRNSLRHGNLNLGIFMQIPRVPQFLPSSAAI